MGFDSEKKKKLERLRVQKSQKSMKSLTQFVPEDIGEQL
jgi:hypothetical protein